MSRLFFKTAITISILTFFNRIFFLFNWSYGGPATSTGIIFLVMELILTGIGVYVSYRFYFFKGVPVLFYLLLAAFGVSIGSYYQTFLYFMDRASQTDDSVWNILNYVIAIIFFAGIFFTPLRRENLFLILGIGGTLLSFMGLYTLLTEQLMLLSLVYLVSMLFQLIWIPIFYREMRKNERPEVLDHN